MSDQITLLHSTDEELEDILESGVLSRKERGEAGELVEDQIKNNVIYLFHPEQIPEWILFGAPGLVRC